MDLTRVPHDEVLRKLDQPQREHLLEDVRRLGHHAHIVDTSEAIETTPLIIKAGHDRVYIDADIDLEKLDGQLRQEEYEAINADRHVPLRQLWTEEATSLLELAVPVTFAVVLEILPPVIVSMMIGSVSGAASPHVLAGSSLSDFFQGQISATFVNGLSAAVATLCAQSFGAKQLTQFWIYTQAGFLACAYCLPPLALLSLNSASLFTLVGQDEELAQVAGRLITISLASLPFQMIYNVARSALQAQTIAAPFVVVSCIAYAISLPLGYYLGRSTSLGYIGVALSNIVGNVLRALAVIPIVRRNKEFMQSWPGWQWTSANTVVWRLWPIMAGSVLMTFFQTAGFYAIYMLCGYLTNPAVVMSANNIASNTYGLAFIPIMGVAAGGTVRVGNALGAGYAHRASVASLVVGVEALMVSVIGIVLCQYTARPFATLFTSDEPTLALAVDLVHYLLFLAPLVASVYATMAIFQACGAQWLGAQLNFLFLFAIGVPLGLVLAIPLHQGVFGLWNGNLIGGTSLVLVGLVWIGRINWPTMAHAARLNAHLHVEREVSSEDSMVTAITSSTLTSP